MEKDIGKIPKNNTTDIIIRLDDFAGKHGVTIREFVTSERYTGFTKAGVKIPAEHLEKFKEMINSVSKSDLESTEEEKSSSSPAKSQKQLKDNSEELPDY